MTRKWQGGGRRSDFKPKKSFGKKGSRQDVPVRLAVLLGDRKPSAETVLSVDPGITCPGFAVWQVGKLVYAKALNLSTKDGLEGRLEKIRVFVTELCETWSPTLAVIEVADEWTREVHNTPNQGMRFDKSRPVNVESLEKLCLSIGVVFGATSLADCPAFLVYVGEWKGKRSKESTHRDLEMKMGGQLAELKVRNHNALDAIAIGAWFLSASRIRVR